MFFDPSRPAGPTPGKSNAGIHPTDEDVVRTLFEIEKASTPQPKPAASVEPEAVFSGASRGLLWLQATAVAAALGVLGYYYAGSRVASLTAGFNSSRNRVGRTAVSRTVDRSAQAEAEQLLTRVAAGDSEAADQVLAQSPNWTGKTTRTPTADQQILTALNLPNLHAREAAVQAELALDGVPLSDAGLNMLERAVGNPSQRIWALWMLGALGNRGVDPVHTAKIIGAYLADTDVTVRASAVNGLAILATDETIPMLLDRFRNDASPIVQERAAYGLAESGMYTHEQHMTAAATLVGWLDDSTLSAGQRAWAALALRDVSGQHFGADSAAWRNWYESTRR
jgi:HEAT repeat protein